MRRKRLWAQLTEGVGLYSTISYFLRYQHFPSCGQRLFVWRPLPASALHWRGGGKGNFSIGRTPHVDHVLLTSSRAVELTPPQRGALHMLTARGSLCYSEAMSGHRSTSQQPAPPPLSHSVASGGFAESPINKTQSDCWSPVPSSAHGVHGGADIIKAALFQAPPLPSQGHSFKSPTCGLRLPSMEMES